MSITKKLNLLFSGIILMLGLLLGYNFVRQEAKALKIELDERASVLLSSLQSNSEYPVLINDIDSLMRLIKGALVQKDVVSCSIINKDGEVLAKGGENNGTDNKVYEVPIKVQKLTDLLGNQFDQSKENMPEEEIGKVILVISQQGQMQKVKDVTKTMSMIVVFTVLLAGFTSSLLLKFILSNPIEKLTYGTERIAKGDLTYKVPINSGDEIGVLSEAFNQMTQDLQSVTVSRDYVDKIMNSITDTLVVVNPNLTISTVNKPLLNLLGYSEREIVGKHISVLYSEKVTLFEESEWQAMLRHGFIRDYDMNFKPKIGEAIPVSFSASVMKDETGKVVSVVGIARDMREMLKLKRQLFQTEKMAAVGQLAGGVAHEINNPMSVILGFSQTISRRITDENNPLYMPLKSIEREAIRCKKLVGDLLTFSRVSKTEREAIEISMLIDETVSLIESKCRVKDVELKREIPQGLPRLIANKNQIQQVIVNLCNNALDAMAPGGTLTIAASVEKDTMRLKVSDTGQGIPAEIKEKIFEPFFTTKEVGKGTGLGLSISYEIIQKHSGIIEVESELNKGTTFTIVLPLGTSEQVNV